MYYHCRPLKYVKYGKVGPAPLDEEDWLYHSYRWLGEYCGYSPQVWVSNADKGMTGYFRNDLLLKKRKGVVSKRSFVKEQKDSILFGFDVIKGFPVDYSTWNLIISALSDGIKSYNLNLCNKLIFEYVSSIGDMIIEDGDEFTEELRVFKDIKGLDFDSFLKKYLFVESDQFVVPSLNLKAAKRIICKNERQKKKLRKMGFIEDRIVIKG